MELNWNEMEPELQVLRAATPAQRKIRPHPNPPHNGREQQRVSRLFRSAFSMEKLSLYQGDEPLAAEGVKFSSYSLYGQTRTLGFFLDRRTEVHKVTSKQADSRVNKVNSLAVIDGRSHAELCDNVEH